MFIMINSEPHERISYTVLFVNFVPFVVKFSLVALRPGTQRPSTNNRSRIHKYWPAKNPFVYSWPHSWMVVLPPAK